MKLTGGAPKVCLNTRLKWQMLLKPTSREVSLTDEYPDKTDGDEHQKHDPHHDRYTQQVAITNRIKHGIAEGHVLSVRSNIGQRTKNHLRTDGSRLPYLLAVQLAHPLPEYRPFGQSRVQSQSIAFAQRADFQHLNCASIY